MKFFYSINEALKYSTNHSFIIVHRTVCFPIYISYRGYKDWVIFAPGACSRAKPMPIFQRSTYSDSIKANVISLFDPGLLLNKNLTNSWFCGTASRYYAEYVATIIKNFLDSKEVKYGNVILFGTSAGGLPALKIAQSLPKSTVWLGNIQVDVSKHPAFNKMLPVLFPKHDRIECIEAFSERFDARKLDGNYYLHYFQNKSDTPHYKYHYKSYREWAKGRAIKANVTFYEYDDAASGHGSVGRQREINIIEQLIFEKTLNINWAERVPYGEFVS